MSDRHEQDLYLPRRPRSDKFVCATCLKDQALQQFAQSHGEMRPCDYCGGTPTTASVAALQDVIEFMGTFIAEEYTDPENDAPWNQEKERYDVKIFDNDELLDEIGFSVSNWKLMADISAAFAGHNWCQRRWERLTPSQRWHYGWERFQHVVKHQRRYTFWYLTDDWDDGAHPDYLPPAHMLGEIGAVINSMKLVKEFPVGTVVWRLQLHSKNESLSTPARFSSPPIQYATQPNRMSPAGVPMFYGADDFHTALLEVIDPKDKDLDSKAVSGAQFRSVMPLNLLDLTSIPTPPSYFTPGGPSRRHHIEFLNKFVKDLSLPIERDERQHIEYVPTQVFTEFVRHVMKDTNCVQVHGIWYSSSRNGRPCCVIFATQEECLPCDPLSAFTQMLEYVAGSIKTVDAAEASRVKVGDLSAEFEEMLRETE